MILIKLIKKELMHFFRKKLDVVTMLLFPIVLIVVMGVALNGLMSVDNNIFENEKVYYKANTINKNSFDNFKKNLEKTTTIKFKEVKNQIKAKEEVDKGNALAFIIIEEEGYSFYRNSNKENTSQVIFRNIFEQTLDKEALIKSLSKENPQVINEILEEQILITLKEEGIKNNGIDSFTYYTFAELVLIILYISGITLISTYKENLYNTMSRIKISKASYISIVISKVFLGLMIGIMQIIVVYIVSTVFLKVNWGENIVLIILVLVSLIVFSSVFGIVSGMIFADAKTASSISNVLIIIMGFLGGSYMPISLINSTKITSLLAQFTPTYWANISLISLSSGVGGNYYYISILISLGLSIALIILGLLFNKIKRGGKFA
ncbi:ABC transporter permease [Romboutsia sp.]|uniref:ABC transporter permease n=1 Tax=Romboutsia sp. TaxID=1965302 RepID=UPI003F337C53